MTRKTAKKIQKKTKKQPAATRADWRRLVLDYSPYLAAGLPAVKTVKNPAAAFEKYLAETGAALAQAATDHDIMALLRQAKRRVATLTGIADMSGAWNDLQVMRALSRFADLAVGSALRFLLLAAHDRGDIRLPARRRPEKDCGVAVIALGKWGAFELNYSSDIDLMVLFDPQKSPVKKKEETQAFFSRLARDLARLLDRPTEDGYVFRTDMRLRPDPGAMPLAVSINAAEVYYGSLGQNWERAAMIKSRAVAGDAAVGEDFQRIMTAWIWRRNLDFAAIQDIHSIKRQINSSQSARRATKRLGARKNKTAENPFLGFNAKLGHGGIREIEFFAQTQQLIYGGREPRLRCPDTLSALAMLKETGHTPPGRHDRLAQAYLFLRHTEHRLQMQEDRQTHSLPDTQEEYDAFARFMGYDSPADFTADLKTHTDGVKEAYGALFVESDSLSGGMDTPGNLVFTGVEDDPETLQTLRRMGFDEPQKVTAAVRGWHHGRYRAVRSERARQILTEITPRLLAALGKTPAPDDAFLRFDRFLSQLPSGVPVFSMFSRRPHQMEVVADVMGTAPALAEHLGTHPQVLDGVLTRDFFGRLPDRKELAAQLARQLAAARDYQDILDVTRLWARERRFHAGIHLLKNLSPPDRCGLYFADIAQTAVEALIPRVTDEFAAAHGRFHTGEFIILSMGSFAAQEMFADSDLDIVALYQTDPGEPMSDGDKPLGPATYHIRLMQRLTAALSAPTAEGTLYTVDTRLRPAGNDGPLAAQLKGFLEYQRNHAWVWEHMCLIRSRPVFARAATARKMKAAFAKILSAPRDAAALKKEMMEMRGKVERQFGSKDLWHMKYRRGGLMDIMFVMHYLILKNAAAHKELIEAPLEKALAALAAQKLIGKKDAQTLVTAHKLAQATQGFLRLAARHPFQPEKASPALLAALVRSVTAATGAVKGKGGKLPDYQTFAAQSDKCFQDSYAIYQKIFE